MNRKSLLSFFLSLILGIALLSGCGGGSGGQVVIPTPVATPQSSPDSEPTPAVTPTSSPETSPSPTPSPTPSPSPSPTPSPGPSEFRFNLTYSGNNPFDATHPILLVVVDRTMNGPIGLVKATQNGTYTIKSTDLSNFNPSHSYALAILHDLDNNGYEDDNDPVAYYYYNGSNNTSENNNSIYSYTPISLGQTYTFTFSGGPSVDIIIY